MGQLEYQAMLSLRDVAHDATGICTVRKRQAVLPIHHVQNHTCRVTLFQPARRAPAPCWASPLAFGLIGYNCLYHNTADGVCPSPKCHTYLESTAAFLQRHHFAFAYIKNIKWRSSPGSVIYNVLNALYMKCLSHVYTAKHALISVFIRSDDISNF
jgi:hypothetical protein